MTREEIAELRRLDAESTPGPWKRYASVEIVQLIPHSEVPDAPWDMYPGSKDVATSAWDSLNDRHGGIAEVADVDLIVATRNALCSLLSAAERALELEERVREAIADEARDGSRMARLELDLDNHRQCLAAERETCLRWEEKCRQLEADRDYARAEADEQKALACQLAHNLGAAHADRDRAVQAERERCNEIAMSILPYISNASCKPMSKVLSAIRTGKTADQLIAELEGSE